MWDGKGRQLSLGDLVSQQASTIRFLQKRVAKLEAENEMLKRALMRDLDSQTVSYREIKDQLDRLSKPILEIVLDLCKRLKRPVHADEVVNASMNSSRFPWMKKVKHETITRRLRELRSKGLLTSPKRGYFYPNIPKSTQREIPYE